MANTSALKKGAPPTRESTPPLVEATPGLSKERTSRSR